MNLEEGDLETIKESFGVQWSMDIDAQYFTPGRRNRTYISNITLFIRDGDSILDEVLLDASYLTDKFAHSAHLCCDIQKTDRIVVKEPCFIGQKNSRIDPQPKRIAIKHENATQAYINSVDLSRIFEIQPMIRGIQRLHYVNERIMGCVGLPFDFRCLSLTYFHCLFGVSSYSIKNIFLVIL